MGILNEEEKTNLTREIMGLLDEYDYDYTTKGIDTIIDTWVENKGDIITLMKNHPNYIGNFMIVLDENFSRKCDKNEIMRFFNWIFCNVVHTDFSDNLPEELLAKKEKQKMIYLPEDLYAALEDFYNEEQYISEEMANKLSIDLPNLHIKAGQKTSKVLNKICKYLGYNTHPDYNRMFAKYSDNINPLEIARYTVISANPIDYLTMSFGNSWASCHTIDRKNKRNMPNHYHGQYSSGTISYALDKTSVVMYTIEKSYLGSEYYTQPKINRCMFHWEFPLLIQGRVYPQGEDGNTEIYEKLRAIVQRVFSEMYNVPNLWVNQKGNSAVKKFAISDGTHYKDYENFSSCNISLLKGENIKDKYVHIGHTPICIRCGRLHDNSETIDCCEVSTCTKCGYIIDVGEEIEISGEVYCRDCVNYCNHCEEYYVDHSYYIEGFGGVCEYCFDGYYTTCDICENHFSSDSCINIESENICVCDDCFSEKFCECDSCYNVVRNNEILRMSRGWFCSDCAERETNDEEENEEVGA